MGAPVLLGSTPAHEPIGMSREVSPLGEVEAPTADTLCNSSKQNKAVGTNRCYVDKSESTVVSLFFFIVTFLGSALIVHILKIIGLEEIYEAYLVPYWLTVIYVFVKAEGRKFEEYGFSTSIKIPYAIFSAFLAFALIFLALTLGTCLRIYKVSMVSNFHVASLIMYFIIILISSLGEEAIFRGYLLFKLSESLGIRASTLIVSLLFSLLHFSNPGYNVISFIQLFLAGILLSIMVVYGGSIVYPVLYHAFWNYTQVLLGFPVSGHEYDHSILTLNYNVSNDIITGGEFGLEGSVLGIVATLLGLIVTKKFLLNVQSK